MKDLKFDTGITIKEMGSAIKVNFAEGEEIVADCLAENSNLTITKLGLGFALGLTWELAASSPEFKIVATNKKVYVVGYDHTKSRVNGGKEFEYNEIKELTLKKDGEKAKLVLVDGTKFSLGSLPLTDHPELTERTKKTFAHIASVIDEDKVINA